METNDRVTSFDNILIDLFEHGVDVFGKNQKDDSLGCRLFEQARRPGDIRLGPIASIEFPDTEIGKQFNQILVDTNTTLFTASRIAEDSKGKAEKLPAQGGNTKVRYKHIDQCMLLVSNSQEERDTLVEILSEDFPTWKEKGILITGERAQELNPNVSKIFENDRIKAFDEDGLEYKPTLGNVLFVMIAPNQQTVYAQKQANRSRMLAGTRVPQDQAVTGEDAPF